MSEQAWRIFFRVAAAFNFAAGLPLLMAPAAILVSVGQPVPEDLLFHRFTGLLVACFGLAYAMASRDLERNRAIVWTGVIGKSGVVLLFAQAWFQGAVPFAAFAVSLGDLGFVIGFLLFLLRRKRVA
jgi:energy-converting hydrogenase Eha subunit G